MKKLIIKATALTFISVTTVFAAMANDGGFDQRVEFPELMKMQQEFAEQKASHQSILNSTADFSKAVDALNAITDHVKLAKRLAYLKEVLAAHNTALGEMRSKAGALFNKTQKEFADNAKTVEDVEPIEPEIRKVQRGNLNEIKKGIIKNGNVEIDNATKKIVRNLKSMGQEKEDIAKSDMGVSTDPGMPIATVREFLDTLVLNYNSVNHHLEVTEGLQMKVQKLSMELGTAMVNGSVIESAVFQNQEIRMRVFDGIGSLSIRRDEDINDDELYD